MAPIWPDLIDGGSAPLAPLRNVIIDMRGNRVSDPVGAAKLRYCPGPSLRVRSGRVVASDAFLIRDEPIAFSQAIPVGDHPTQVIRARDETGNERIAMAVLRIRDETPASWTMATRIGESLGDLKRGERFAYGVDMGAGCFVDIETALAIDPALPTDEGVYQSMQQRLESSDGFASVAVDGSDGNDIVAFHSGRGDGSYTSYWGLGPDQQPICLVTDFGIVKISAFDGAHQVVDARSGLSKWLKGWTRR